MLHEDYGTILEYPGGVESIDFHDTGELRRLVDSGWRADDQSMKPVRRHRHALPAASGQHAAQDHA